MALINWQPPTDVFYFDKTWFVKLEVAGIDPRELEIRCEERSLYIAGKRRDLVLAHSRTYHMLEIFYHRFERLVTLPVSVDPNSLRWEYRDGMLLIQVYSSEQESL